MPQPARSAKLQLLDGNPNKKNTNELKKRADQENRLKMKSDQINPPKWLDKDGKKVFKILKKELIAIDLLTNGDVYHLALYCDAYSQYLIFKKQIEDNGPADSEGKPNPFYSKMEKAATQMRAFGSDLGLSPSSRAKLAIKLAGSEDDEDDDDF